MTRVTSWLVVILATVLAVLGGRAISAQDKYTVQVPNGLASGIGLEAAKLFRQEGATVIIVGQNPARLQSAASQLGDSVTVLRGDVSKLAEVESIIKQISEKFGRIDVLYANARMGLASSLEAVTEDQIDR